MRLRDHQIERLTDADIERLGAIVEVQRGLVRDPLGFRVSDLEFHRTIMDATGNPFLIRVSHSLYVLGMEFTRESAGEHGESHGTTRLYVNDEVVAEGPMRTQLAYFTLCGDGLCVGRDSSDAVTSLYEAPAPFRGGTISHVEVNVGADQYLDLEKEALAALARE